MVGGAPSGFNSAESIRHDYHARVHRLILRIITAIQLTRLTMAFGAVADVWFVILLTRAHGEYNYLPVYGMNLPGALLAGATVAIGLFAYGASLNDVLDARHERADHAAKRQLDLQILPGAHGHCGRRQLRIVVRLEGKALERRARRRPCGPWQRRHRPLAATQHQGR